MNIQALKAMLIEMCQRVDYKSLLKSKKAQVLAISISLGVVIFTILMLAASHPLEDLVNNKQTKVNKVAESPKNVLAQQELSGKLEDINAQLARLNQTMNGDKTLSAQDKQNIKQKINQISGTIGGLAKESSVNEISNSLIKETTSLNQQVNDLNETVKLIELQIKQGNYISPDNLPYRVEAIDIWNGAPYAAVNLSNHVELLAKNDAKMGWWIKEIDYQHQQVIFANNQNQLIKINLREQA